MWNSTRQSQPRTPWNPSARARFSPYHIDSANFGRFAQMRGARAPAPFPPPPPSRLRTPWSRLDIPTQTPTPGPSNPFFAHPPPTQASSSSTPFGGPSPRQSYSSSPFVPLTNPSSNPSPYAQTNTSSPSRSHDESIFTTPPTSTSPSAYPATHNQTAGTTSGTPHASRPNAPSTSARPQPEAGPSNRRQARGATRTLRIERTSAFIMPPKRKPVADNFTRVEEELRACGPLDDDDEHFLVQLEKMTFDANLRNRLIAGRAQMDRAVERMPQRQKEMRRRGMAFMKKCEEEEPELERLAEERAAELAEELAEEERIREEEKDARRREEIRELQRKRIEDAMKERRRLEENRRRLEAERREREKQEEAQKRREREWREVMEARIREREMAEQRRREAELEALRRRDEQARRERERQRQEQERQRREQEQRAEQRRRAEAYVEEQRRLAEQERAARAAHTNNVAELVRVFELYDGKWEELRTKTRDEIPPIALYDLPWPVLVHVRSAQDITLEGVRAFVFHPLRPGMQEKTLKQRLRQDVVKWHPDKFNNTTLPRVREDEREAAREAAGEVVKFLNQLMSEVEAGRAH